MKYSNINIVIVLLLISSSVLGNDPTMVPWPVGTEPGMIYFTKTLMNSYGEPNTWIAGRFHAGIDIDWQTEPYGSQVRCILDGTVSCIKEIYNGQYTEWLMVTTDGTGQSSHEDYGWWYGHILNPWEYGEWELWDSISPGDFIAPMHNLELTPHIHFKWSWWEWPDETDELWDWCYVNPLDYLDPAPVHGTRFAWIFNPNNNDPSFRFFFLEDVPDPFSWPSNAGDVENLMLEEDNLTGDIDVFFGFSLKGEGESTTPDCGRDDLAPERIGWNIVRETASGDEIIEENYNVNFNCPLSNQGDDNRVRQLYFRHQLGAVFPEDDGDGLIVCLTNCGDMQGWENLGIDNIEENCWDTNADYQFNDDTINPVLAAYKDGPYKIDVTCYSHGDPAEEFNKNFYCELHNFHPAVEEVIISGSSGDIYHAQWTTSGLSIITDDSVGNNETLDIEVIFSEPMNTSSAVVTAGLESPFDQITAVGTGWSSSNCPEDPSYRDTWHGTLSGMAFLEGEMTISIQAEDTDANVLMEPSIAFIS